MSQSEEDAAQVRWAREGLRLGLSGASFELGELMLASGCKSQQGDAVGACAFGFGQGSARWLADALRPKGASVREWAQDPAFLTGLALGFEPRLRAMSAIEATQGSWAFDHAMLGLRLGLAACAPGAVIPAASASGIPALHGRVGRPLRASIAGEFSAGTNPGSTAQERRAIADQSIERLRALERLEAGLMERLHLTLEPRHLRWHGACMASWESQQLAEHAGGPASPKKPRGGL